MNICKSIYKIFKKNFSNKVSLCSFGCPRIYSVDEVDLKLKRCIHLLLPPSAGTEGTYHQAWLLRGRCFFKTYSMGDTTREMM